MLATTLGIWDPNVAQILSGRKKANKNNETVAELQESKCRVSTYFSRKMGLGGLGLCFYFGRWCCLCAEFYSLNEISMMASVVLRSGSLLPLHSECCICTHI